MDFSPTLIDAEPINSAPLSEEIRVSELESAPQDTFSSEDFRETVAKPGRMFVPSGNAISPPPLRSDLVYFKLIRNWEGVVAGVSVDSFTAHVRDVRNGADQGDEEFEIELDRVPNDDRPLVREGAIFFLTIGYWVTKGGQRSTDIRIVFRRMPKWSANDIARANRRAEEYLKFFGMEQRAAKTA